MISIALATYNGSKFIREQLDSILTQTRTDFEVIACDDCSTDNTVEILREYELKDNRFHIFQNEQNLGFKKNFEKTLTLCSGDYIACCDQDDIWTDDHLEVLLNNIGSNDCIGANGLIINQFGDSLGLTVKDSLSITIFPNDSKSIFRHECFYNIIQGTACLFRRTLLENVIPFPDNIRFHDHWIALNASMNNGCKYISDTILKYRTHEKNVTGYRKFNLFHALTTTIQARKYRKTMYIPNLVMLRSIKKKFKDPQSLSYISNAIVFFENLSSGKNRFRSVLFYIRNYNEISLCPRKKWKLFIYRVFCLLLFGIML